MGMSNIGEGFPPASISKILTDLFSESLAAKRHPAVPAPTKHIGKFTYFIVIYIV